MGGGARPPREKPDTALNHVRGLHTPGCLQGTGDRPSPEPKEEAWGAQWRADGPCYPLDLLRPGSLLVGWPSAWATPLHLPGRGREGQVTPWEEPVSLPLGSRVYVHAVAGGGVLRAREARRSR